MYFQICDELKIKEKNYFGLRHTVNDTSLWLNLRNPVLTQVRPHLPGKPHRLRLEVKFFVSPQEIQEEETRLASLSVFILLFFSVDSYEYSQEFYVLCEALYNSTL